MTRKIEQWVDNEGLFHSSELEALKSDLYDAIDDSNSEDDESPKLTSEVVAAIDALHEYAHRGDAKGERPVADSGIAPRVGRKYRLRESSSIARIVRVATLFMDQDGDCYDDNGKHLGGPCAAAPTSRYDLVEALGPA